MTDPDSTESSASGHPPGAGLPDRMREVAERQPPFATTIGFRLLSFTRDEVVGELVVTPELGNRNGVLHGGALMAFADNLGGTSASINLPEGASTTTVESKTSFFRAVPIGATVRGVCVPLHRGRTTSVWQTSVRDSEERLVAVVQQTQMTLWR
jgi:1,4-dihydroxy-2-naphthoyl-CoA hydrolase